MDFRPEVLKECLEKDLADTKVGIGETNSYKEAAGFLLLKSFLKKFSSATTTNQANIAAFEKFKGNNDVCAEWKLPVDGIELIVLQRAKAIMHKNFYQYDGLPRFALAEIANLAMVGPGASRLAAGDDLWSKLFHGPISATNPKLYRWYLATIGWNENWAQAEFTRAEAFGDQDDHNIQGNKMFFVPKDADISRPACTEPTLNMFFQKGLGDAICKHILPLHGISLDKQQLRNKWFARAGSLNDSYATIDLASASDTISWNLVNWILPERLLATIRLIRSDCSVTPFGDLKLNMVSTMGNGFTFPLQTWLFGALTQAVYEVLGYPVKDPNYKHARQYTVFGDDIICVSSAYGLLVRVLHAAGFTVNTNKSYSSGPFRESCGGDFFKGRDVRAVYFKEFSQPSHGYSVINRLTEWSIRHEILLPRTFEYLLARVPFRPVPLYEDITSGIRTPVSGLRSRKRDKDGNYLYHALVPRANWHKVDEDIYEKYHSSLLIAFLHGSLACRPVSNKVTKEESFGIFISKRSLVTKYQSVKRSSVISWNFVPHPRINSRDYDRNWHENIMPSLR